MLRSDRAIWFDGIGAQRVPGFARRMQKTRETPSGAMVWFRSDLRTHDNPALIEAEKYVAVARAAGQRSDANVVGMLVVSPYEWKRLRFWGLAKTDYYLRSVRELRASLAAVRVPLVVRQMPEQGWSSPEAYYAGLAACVVATCRETGCDAVYMNGEYDGVSMERDARVAEVLDSHDILYHASHDQCAVPVGKLYTKTGTPFKIFSQFKRAWAAYIEQHGLSLLPQPQPPAEGAELGIEMGEIPDGGEMFDTDEFPHLDLGRVRDAFPAGEEAASRSLAVFLERSSANYHEDRNHFQDGGSSRLSAPLAVGSISLKRCVVDARTANGGSLLKGQEGLTCWISELCWRDFYRHVLHHFPHVAQGKAFRPEFQDLPWRGGWSEGEDGSGADLGSHTGPDAKKTKTDTATGHLDGESASSACAGENKEVNDEFRRWCEGRTGVPIVDAAMRQLVREGWQNNRVRMVTAMYLTKNLLIHWRRGERFFMRNLVDCDYASNNGGWQWSASTGTDSQPYFRIFNPLLQSEKFDREGAYIRRYVPELAALAVPAIHDPTTRLPKPELAKLSYPTPIIDHATARERALALFTTFAKKKSE